MNKSRWFKKLLYCIILLALVPVGVVGADYIGPRRTVTETVAVVDHCDYTLYTYSPPAYCSGVYVCTVTVPSCSYPSVDQQSYWCCYRDWDLVDIEPHWVANESYVDTFYRNEQRVISYPPATISATVNCAQVGQGGWCVSGGSLSLSAIEPVSGYSITYLEGTQNGSTFFCWGDSCQRAFAEGNNDFTYWAHSNWNDTSLMGTTSGVKYDSRPPIISGGVTGITGNENWFNSAVTLNATAVDPEPGSGLSSFEYSLDGGAWQPFLTSITVITGSHTIDLRATDLAGNVATYSTLVSIDTVTPVSVFTTSLPETDWVRGTVNLVGESVDNESGIALVELSWDAGENWQPLTGTTIWSYDWDTSGFVDGTYILLAHAQDKAGNWENTARLSVNVDNTSPEVELISPASFCPSCGSVSLGYSVTDETSGIASWELLLDETTAIASGTGAGNGSAIWRGTGLPLGLHQLTLRAWDLAGNMSEFEADIDLTQRPVSDDPTATRTMRPTKTVTPVPTKTNTPTVTRTPTTTVIRIITFPTVTKLPNLSNIPENAPQYEEVQENARNLAPLTNLGQATIGIFIAALLAFGGYLAVEKILRDRIWAFETELATHGMGDAFWLPTPPGEEIIKGPPELMIYAPQNESNVRTDPVIAQAIDVQKLLEDEFPGEKFSTNDYNLCGLISVAALLGKPLKEILCSFVRNVPDGKDILTNPRGTSAAELIPIYSSFGWQAEMKQAGTWQTRDPNNYGAPSWQEIANLLNTGHGITALVRLNTTVSGDNIGTLSKAGVPGVNHWVDILEIIKGNAGVYVRIYNPYNNREETLRWADFLNAWNNVPPQNGSASDGIPYYQAIVSRPPVKQIRRFQIRNLSTNNNLRIE